MGTTETPAPKRGPALIPRSGRIRSVARTSRIDQDPDLALFVAEKIMDGFTNDQVAEVVGEGTDPRTIGRWKQHPIVRGHLNRLRDDRANRVDSKIMAHLLTKIETPQEIKKLSVKELLEIRRELLGPATQRHVVSKGANEDEALAALMTRLQDDPKLAEALGLAGALPAADFDELEPGEEIVDAEAVEEE